MPYRLHEFVLQTVLVELDADGEPVKKVVAEQNVFLSPNQLREHADEFEMNLAALNEQIKLATRGEPEDAPETT